MLFSIIYKLKKLILIYYYIICFILLFSCMSVFSVDMQFLIYQNFILLFSCMLVIKLLCATFKIDTNYNNKIFFYWWNEFYILPVKLLFTGKPSSHFSHKYLIKYLSFFIYYSSFSTSVCHNILLEIFNIHFPYVSVSFQVDIRVYHP